MLHPTHLIPIMAAWHLSMTELSKYKPAPVSKNINHLLHTLTFMLMYTQTHEVEYATHISIGFYSYDIIYMLSMTHDSIRRNASYLLHHAIAIYLLNLTFIAPGHAESILKGYSILESSNIMLYVSYHVQKECPQQRALIMCSEFIQLLWYTYYRIFKMTIFVYQIRDELRAAGGVVCAMIAALHVMGAMWSYKLMMKNAQHYAVIKKMAA